MASLVRSQMGTGKRRIQRILLCRLYSGMQIEYYEMEVIVLLRDSGSLISCVRPAAARLWLME